MKYKVIKDYPTDSGILYKNELVKEDGNSTLKGHIRVKDNMGRIWFVPKENLAKKKWCFQNLMIYIIYERIRRSSEVDIITEYQGSKEVDIHQVD